MGYVERDTTVTQIVTSLTGKNLFRCEEILLLGHQCFNFASGACDSCMRPLCSSHKYKREEIGRNRTVTYLLCARCVATYDYEKELSIRRKDSRRLFYIPE